jgi:outer membrane protein OmpA-like peptidoglycan-associated protein
LLQIKGKNMQMISRSAMTVLGFGVLASPVLAHDSLKPVLDKDGKHVLDARGNCVRSNQPGKDTCADEPAPVVQKTDLRKEELVVYFPFDSAKLTNESQSKLNRVADVLKTTAQKAKIVGYADQIGTDSYNVKLSERRANAVTKYLNGRGFVDASTADVRGLGETDSQSRCEGIKKRLKLIECLWKDRRVEIELQY